MIKYIGSKRRIVPAIVAAIQALPEIHGVVDLFSGTTRVSQGLKSAGLSVHANDLASYSEVLAQCYIETDATEISMNEVKKLLAHLERLSPRSGYFTATFCVQSRYFHPKNGERIDAIREEIDRLDLDRPLRAIAMTSLLEAADRVDSTTGLQMAFLKNWAPRALTDLELRIPRLLPLSGRVSREDANQLIRRIGPVDCAYVDPPYNQHSFYRNYHVWETLIRNDQPEVYGVACKRIDCRAVHSLYNSRLRFHEALEDLLDRLESRYVVLSCSSEGYLEPRSAYRLLQRWGSVGVVGIETKRYVGAQIGIHNPQGQKVGKVSHLRNEEYLFIAGPESDAVEAAVAAASRSTPGARPLRLNSLSGRSLATR